METYFSRLMHVPSAKPVTICLDEVHGFQRMFDYPGRGASADGMQHFVSSDAILIGGNVETTSFPIIKARSIGLLFSPQLF